MTSKKIYKGRALKVRLVGPSEHAYEHESTWVAVMKKYETRDNDVIKALYRFNNFKGGQIH